MPGRQRRDGGSNGPAADNKNTGDNVQGRGGDRGRGRGRDDRRGRDDEKSQYIERVVTINRVSKVVKGGRRFSFTALVILGDGNGMVGSATARPRRCRRRSRRVPRRPGRTSSASRSSAPIPHPIQGEEAAGVVMLRPASPGTGVIAGGAARAVLECAGVHDILCKSLGSDNAINVVHATVAALKGLHRPEEVAARRGLPIEDVAPAGMLRARAGQGA